MTLGDLFEDSVVFLGLCPVNLVVFVQPNHRHVRRHVDDFETVNLGEFCSLRHGGARHAGQFRVEAEIVLEGDRGERLILCLHFDAFFGFQRLVQSVRIPAAFHHAAGKLVDDDDFTVFDDVIGVAAKKRMCTQRLVRVMDDGDVLDVVERTALQDAGVVKQVFDALRALFG